MAEKIISPGVFTNEIDQTFLPSAIGEIGAALIGPTVKGPAGIPTVVTSYSEFQARFGDTFKSGSDYYQYFTSHTAREYLKHGSKLTVVRILDGSYGGASATISSSVDPAIVGGGNKHTASLTIAGPILSASFIGSHGSASFTPTGGSEVKFVFTGSINRSGLLTDSATLIYVDSGSGVGAAALTNAALNLKNAINISSSLHNLPISASSDVNVVGLTSSIAGNFGVYTSPTQGVTPAPVFGGSQAVGNFVEIAGHSGSMTSKSLGGGHDFNTDTFKESFKLHTLSDGEILNSVGPIGTNNVLESGSKDNLRWEIGSLNQKKGTFTLLLRRGDDSSKRKQTLETWNNLTLDENSTNYISKVIGDQVWTLNDSGGTDPYLSLAGDYPNKSKYVRVEVIEQTVDYLDENGNIRVNVASASLPLFHSGSNSGSFGGSFSGGSDGTVQHPKNFYDSITDSNSQGLILTSATEYEDAINILGNQDEYDINLVLLPGVIDNQTGGSSIITKAIDMCEDRGDCFVISDPTLYSAALTTATTEAKTRDSNYAATYWPWVQISDADLGRNRWVPPSVVVAGMYAFNDKVAHEWFAPAGLNRGTLDSVVQAERKLSHSNRDTLYDSNVNPIATFPTSGVTVWGQKTLQKKSSALDRVNVRRLLIKVKKFIASSSRFLVFEQNNASTRRRFLNIVNPFLEQVQSNSGLNAFRVVMDESNNTPDVVDRNVLYGQIFVQPTRTAEFIVLDFTVQPTGATFPE